MTSCDKEILGEISWKMTKERVSYLKVNKIEALNGYDKGKLSEG